MEDSGGYDCPWRAEGLWSRPEGPQDPLTVYYSKGQSGNKSRSLISRIIVHMRLAKFINSRRTHEEFAALRRYDRVHISFD